MFELPLLLPIQKTLLIDLVEVAEVEQRRSELDAE